MDGSGWRWWCFVGIAHETPRMVYEPPMVRLARFVAAVRDYYAAAFLSIGSAFAAFARALSGVGPETCRCGHARTEHYAERGECMFSTEEETWACGCHEYEPAGPATHVCQGER